MSELSWAETDAQADLMVPGRYSMEWQVAGLPTQVREVVLARRDGVMMWRWAVDTQDDAAWFQVSIALKSGTLFRSLVDDINQLFTFRWSVVGTADSEHLSAAELVQVCLQRMGTEGLLFIFAFDKEHGERRVLLYFWGTAFDPTKCLVDRGLSRQLCEELNRMLSNAIFERDGDCGCAAGSVDVGGPVAAGDQC